MIKFLFFKFLNKDIKTEDLEYIDKFKSHVDLIDNPNQLKAIKSNIKSLFPMDKWKYYPEWDQVSATLYINKKLSKLK